MRDNGLGAVSYAAIGDLDQRITDAVLHLLREAGVAAYVQPEPIDDDPRSGERDRLFVDAGEIDQALDLLQREVPALHAELAEADGSGRNVDLSEVAEIEERVEPVGPGNGAEDTGESSVDEAAWADIVASYNRDLGDAPVGPWPAQEDLESDEPRSEPASDPANDPADDGPDDADDEPGTVATRRDGGELDDMDDTEAGAGTAVATPRGDTDEHFVPPEPPPLPKVDGITKAAWVGLIGGPLLLLLIVIADLSVPPWLRVLAVAACGGGFLTLVLRSRDPEGGGDNGAVV